MDPGRKHFQEFTISATVLNIDAKFDCVATLYDNQMNKLDEETFSFVASGEQANIVDIDGERPIGRNSTEEGNGDQCDDTKIFHI